MDDVTEFAQKWVKEIAERVHSDDPFAQVVELFSGVMLNYGDILNSLRTLVEELCRIEDTGCETWEYVKAEVVPNSVPENVRKLIGLDW